jgi:hypothetical protein
MHGLGRVNQRVFRHQREIGEAAGDGAQIAIFELLGAPESRELSALAGKRLLHFGNDGIRIKNDEIVEGHGFEARCGLRVRVASEAQKRQTQSDRHPCGGQ